MADTHKMSNELGVKRRRVFKPKLKIRVYRAKTQEWETINWWYKFKKGGVTSLQFIRKLGKI